ncbi:cytochrome P450 [Suillus tomentosus]|nr:cytochrome P450 [Suillus tomentosus]
MDSISLFSLLLTTGIIWMITKLLSIGRREQHLPPGPPTVPILGNALMVPPKFAQLKFTEWAQQYGGIFSLKIGHGTVVVVSDATVLKEFMDKRSNETSGRPSFYTGSLIMDGYFIAEADSMTDIWHMGRKALQTLLSPQSVNKHLPVAVAESSQLLFDLLRSPQDFEKHIDRYTFSILLSIAFGKHCPRPDTEEERIFYEGVRLTVQVVSAEGPPVDLLPILKYVPERWAPWKRICREARTLQRRLYFGLLEEAETRLARGESTGCFMEEVIQRQEELGMSKDAAAWLGAIVLKASHSSGSFISSLILCFVAFPETLRKAQNEIDSVLPDGRPPTMDDIASLPYVHAILREVHRLKPMAPLGMPHALLETQEYRSSVIPKGTTVFINAWGILHDPEAFDEPKVFRPERFLLSEHRTKPGVDSKDWCASIPFGSGRRLCPGMNLVNTNLAFTIATLAWAFDFAAAIDPVTKAPIPVDIDAYEEGLVFRPRPFACSISPRSEAKARLIRERFTDATPAFSKYELFLTKEEK